MNIHPLFIIHIPNIRAKDYLRFMSALIGEKFAETLRRPSYGSALIDFIHYLQRLFKYNMRGPAEHI